MQKCLIKKCELIVCSFIVCFTIVFFSQNASAIGCPDVEVIFVRGSGAEVSANNDYIEFKRTIEEKLKTTKINYSFVDLDYPAIGVGIDNFDVLVGAIVGAGESFRFGESVSIGINNLVERVNNSICTNTKYVLGGYSQGAMVISKALKNIDANKIIYAATFGDPKLYLPEGAGPVPVACGGNNLSDYRMYVPDCRAYSGILGGLKPYEEPDYSGKLGTWCNKKDIMCSSYLSVGDHVSYISDHLYEDASKVIFDKVAKYYNIKNNISSPHDTAILIDSTGSMANMIDKFRNEALRLAEETFKIGGRVALYDYRDLSEYYIPKARCVFESCTMETFKNELNNIVVGGGGRNSSESLLSASFKVMSELKWQFGATKSLIVLTDSDYYSPDIDGKTIDDVVALSKSIDPVNFYIITTPWISHYYTELAERTGGMVETNFDKLSLLTDYINARFDTLPRVEETIAVEPLPIISNILYEQYSKDTVKIMFDTDGEKVLLSVDDFILGFTNDKELLIGELSAGEHVISLAPIKGNLRGESHNVKVLISDNGFGSLEKGAIITIDEDGVIIPGVPNTGKK